MRGGGLGSSGRGADGACGRIGRVMQMFRQISLPIRLAALWNAPAAPLLLLLLALSAVFVFGHPDRERFYRGNGPSDGQSSANLMLAANMSPEHNFLGFRRLTLDEDGEVTYVPYNRFPPAGYALIKLVILPFGEDIAAQIYAARVFMLIAFAATALLAYLSLRRLTSHRWIAFSAALLTFSSTYWLYTSDMIAQELGLDLFGMMLAFHGMVVFEQEGRFRQLAVKACVGMLLGWHIYGLLLAFVALGLIKTTGGGGGRYAQMAAGGGGLREISNTARLTVARMVRSRYMALGVITLLFGIATMSFNLGNEYLALRGDTPLAELPTSQSILKRGGLNAEFNAANARNLAWGRFLQRQFHRIGGLSLPYALPGYMGGAVGWPEGSFMRRNAGVAAMGVLATCACFVGLAFSRERLLFGALALSGFLWAFPMRFHTYIHAFEAVSYTGVPLVLFALALLGARRLGGERAIALIAAFALTAFALSAYRMAEFGYDAKGAMFHEAITADFETIRRITDGKVVFVPAPAYSNHEFSGSYRTTDYYLSGSVILYYSEGDRRGLADFVLTRERLGGVEPLTPNNRLRFLYERGAYDRAQMAALRQSFGEAGRTPVARGEFDLHLSDSALHYFKEPCAAADTADRFFLHIFPADAADLPDGRRRHGFVNADFYFSEHGLALGGVCLAAVELPDYGIERIRTGQYVSGAGETWRAEFEVGG